LHFLTGWLSTIKCAVVAGFCYSINSSRYFHHPKTQVNIVSSEHADDATNPLGPARPLVLAALMLGTRAAATGDHAGSYSLYACAARLARQVRGISEAADFRLERSLDEAGAEADPTVQANMMLAGLRALIDDETADRTVPNDPLAAAQRFIRMAIAIGAPAFNAGDRQGCFEVYFCTARMVLATLHDLPTELNAKLREALDQCAELDDVDEQAWTMRHAFDAVGEMSNDERDVTLGEVRILLAHAVSIGAPAFNLGDHRGCYDIYACTGRLLVNSAAVPERIKDVLRDALARASVVPDVSRQAWMMREAFDAILGVSGAPSDSTAETDEA
jgi:hypothetical protein